MWDERYGTDSYAYGITPNQFLEENFQFLPKGKILSLAEGEGRNAVFLARQGYHVTAVDSSKVGLEKAQKLAKENDVTIDTIHADLAEFDIGQEQWDGIISIFVPLPSLLRQEIHQKIIAGLKPKGVYLVEAYRPEQIKNETGGGKSVDTMTSKASLAQELSALTFHHLIETEREIIEGDFHTGIGAVTQAIASKS